MVKDIRQHRGTKQNGMEKFLTALLTQKLKSRLSVHFILQMCKQHSPFLTPCSCAITQIWLTAHRFVAPCRGWLKSINQHKKLDKGPTNSNEINLREDSQWVEHKSHTCQSERVGCLGPIDTSRSFLWAQTGYYDQQPNQDYRIGVGWKLVPKEEKEERHVDNRHKWLQAYS